jgi:nucleolar MIF4G domain-containing protein 1
MPLLKTQVAGRKQRRKDERRLRKAKHHDSGHVVREDQQDVVVVSAPRLPASKYDRDDGGTTTEEPTSRHKRTRETQSKKKEKRTDDDTSPMVIPTSSSSRYGTLDANTAAAIERDDEEIAELERKLGKKQRLNKEYATEEGYGDDFGDFLDSLDAMVNNIVVDEPYDPEKGILAAVDDDNSKEGEEETSDVEEELVPMKPEALGDAIDSDSSEEGNDDSSNEEGDARSSDGEDAVDHDENDIYQPVAGEDIYGKSIDGVAIETASKKYVPPHLRDRQTDGRDDVLRAIQRLLNNALNRLSEETLISVVQAISDIYKSYSTSDVNEAIWKMVHNSCIARGSQLMKGLIPLYMAAITGVAIKGASADLGSFVLETSVRELCTSLERTRTSSLKNSSDDADDDETSKESSNLVLICCYLYNFGLAHCSLMYDLVRKSVESFAEVDIENLLLILSHCGRALRTDDPSALKDIVSLVQRRFRETSKSHANNARTEYLVSAVLDLKNNKRKKQDEAITETTSKFRKTLGHIKSANKGVGRGSDISLRITLDDVLNVQTTGRWWKVGASWSGNLDEKNSDQPPAAVKEERPAQPQQFDEKLLKLAAKYRMNTDTRRSAFCIIMGAEDYEDCFEKLVRAGMMKNRVERDAVRVLVECCGNEAAFNKFYSHLAVRMCEYQPQCKFSFQLTFFDLYKQFEETKARKAANLAKLLFELVVLHNCLRISVIKPIDIASPENLSEIEMIFVTIFLTLLLEHFEDPGDAKRFIKSIRNNKRVGNNEDEEHSLDDGQALQASLTVFLVQVMKASPKYKKGSRFRNNLKAMVKACDPVDDDMMG